MAFRVEYQKVAWFEHDIFILYLDAFWSHKTNQINST